MTLFRRKLSLTAEEHAQRRRLILSDSLSLAIIFVITAVLAVLTNAIYQSYASHQAELARRWEARGETALRDGRPQDAIHALRSALALAPGERKIEIELAEALASAGRTTEAVSYFNTLAESEPGNGMINLQLARLAARQGNVAQALENYHRAIYGNWEGNGYIHRRVVRLEMIRFFLAHQLYPEARNELLVTATNAPNDDPTLLLEIAQLMEQAQDPGSALRLYKSVLAHHASSLAAMEGAGRTAYALRHYKDARDYLERAVNNSNSSTGAQPIDQKTRDLLHDASRLLLLYPSPQLSPRDRVTRILADRNIARQRLASCTAEITAQENTPFTPSPAASREHSLLRNPLQTLASRFKHSPPAANKPLPKPAPAETLANLTARWKQQPGKITLSRLAGDPALAEAQVQLIYDTERITQQVCGAPAGDDALLLKIAQTPGMAEQQ